jgi:hypothetical protein
MVIIAYPGKPSSVHTCGDGYEGIRSGEVLDEDGARGDISDVEGFIVLEVWA